MKNAKKDTGFQQLLREPPFPDLPSYSQDLMVWWVID